MALVAAKGAVPVDEHSVRAELGRLCFRGLTEQVTSLLDALPPSQVAPSLLQLDAGGSSALHVAVRCGHLRLLQELLERHCEVEARDASGQTPLHVAAHEGHAELVLELLLGRADPDATDALHETALHKAVSCDTPEVIEVLVDRGGANPALGDGAGTTPLLLAAERGKVGSLEALLKKDPSLVIATNQSGWTALHLAAHGDVMQRKVTTKRLPQFVSMVRLLLDAKAPVDATDEDKKTALHRAATTGNLDCATALVEGGADIMAADICRWTPLHYATQEGNTGVAQLLLISRAAVQCENPPCLTPLAVAVMENQVKMAELLMAYLADPNLRGKGLASPLMIARKEPEKYNDVLALFELGFVRHHA